MTVHVRRDRMGLYVLCDQHASTVAFTDANAFLETLVVRGLSKDTIRSYAFDLQSAYRWLQASGKQLTELNQAMLLDYVAEQRKTAAQPASINHRLTVLRLFYRFVTGSELQVSARTSEPAPYYRGRGRDRALGLNRLSKPKQVKLRVKVPHKVVEPLDRGQVRRFFARLHRYRDLAIVYLMLFCGLRSQEVLSIRLGDLQLAEKQLRIMGKGKRERMMPLPEIIGRVLWDYLRLERPAETTSNHLFVILQGRRRGLPMTISGLRSLFRHRRQRAVAIHNANAHRFRHTFGADMARAGVGLAVLQRMMGHADMKTTLGYINLSMADVAEAYRKAIETIRKRYDTNAG